MDVVCARHYHDDLKKLTLEDVLKQPLQTSVTIDNLDFEAFTVEEQLHIGISVKDFKAIVMHAESLKTSITAMYSFPTRPMQIIYNESGMQSEFTLMTIGEYRGSSLTPAPAAARQSSARPSALTDRPGSRQSTVQAVQQIAPAMPPPIQPASRSFTKEPQSQRTQRPSPPPPKPSLDQDSLFLPIEEDEDRIWGERSFDNEQDVLGWNASAQNAGTGSLGRGSESRLPAYPAWHEGADLRIEPTQRLSQVY